MCVQDAFRIVKDMRTTDCYNTTYSKGALIREIQKCKMQEEEGGVKDSTDA